MANNSLFYFCWHLNWQRHFKQYSLVSGCFQIVPQCNLAWNPKTWLDLDVIRKDEVLEKNTISVAHQMFFFPWDDKVMASKVEIIIIIIIIWLELNRLQQMMSCWCTLYIAGKGRHFLLMSGHKQNDEKSYRGAWRH